MGMTLKGEVSIGGQRLQSVLFKNLVTIRWWLTKVQTFGMGATLKCGIPRPGIPVQLIVHLWVHGRGPRCRRCLEGGGQDRACGREPLLDWMRSVGLAAAQSLRWWFRFPTSSPGRWSWSRGSRCGAITAVRSPLPHSPGPRISGSRCGQIA